MSDLDLGIDFVFNTPEAQAEAERIKNNITSIGNSADAAAKKVRDSVEKLSRSPKEQIGLLENLKIKLAEYQQQASKATSVRSIELANGKIELFKKEIERLTNVGKVGFDDLGNRITRTFERPVGEINRAKEALRLYQLYAAQTFNPELLAKYNAKIEETSARLRQLGNAGKTGYTSTGIPIPQAPQRPEGLLGRLQYAAQKYESFAASSMNPEIISKYNRKLQETQAEINRVKNVGKEGFDALGNKIVKTDSLATKLLGTFKEIGTTLLATFGVNKIVDYIKEARELAAKGEGIRAAFSKLGNNKTLDMLRDATRGATSDIDLMAAALRAKNFQIAPELLAKGLSLAGKVSRETGQDVTYLADSFVNGLGRKSLLILDNLQISQVQLRAEIKKTGDFQTAVSNVVDQKLKQIGEVDDTTADRMARWTTRIANFKELVGQKINMVINYDPLKEANKEFYEAGLQVQALQKNIPPLLSKYDELTAKAERNGGVTKLSKQEQALLKDIIKQVGAEIPGAITQFDKYGNAMSISTTRAKEFIEQQVLVLQALNEERIKKTTDRIGDLNKELVYYKNKLDEISKTGKALIPEDAGAGGGSAMGGGGAIRWREATLEEQKAIVKKYGDITRTIKQQEALRDADSGALLKKRQKEIDDNSKVTKTDDGKAQKAQERQAAIDAKALSAQESLEQKMQVLKDKFQRKGLSKEMEARQAIVDEFKKLAFEIEQQGKKYDAYAKKYGKDKALKVLGPRQTTDIIEPIRTAAIEDLRYRQQTAEAQVSFEKQKKLYEDYENFKTAFGKDAADKRFKNEVKSNSDRLKQLQDDYTKLALRSALGGELTGGEKERMLEKEKQIKELQTIEEKQYSDAYEAAMTFNQKIERINEDFRQKAKELGSKITDEQKTNLLKQRDDLINATKDEALAKTEIYKQLAEETIILTREQVKEQLKALNEILSKGGLPPEVVAKINNQVKGLKLAFKIGVDQANLNTLQTEVERLKKKLNATDEKGNSLISEEEFKRVLLDLGKTQAEVDKLLNSTTGKAKSTFAQGLTENFKYLKGKASEVTSGISNDLGRASSGFTELSDSLGGVNTEAGYTIDTIARLAKAGSDAAGAFASFSSGDIVGGVTKTISAITGVFSIGNKVKEMNAAARKVQDDYYAAAIRGEMDYQALLRKRDIDSAARGKNSYRAIVDQLEALKKQSPEIEKAYNQIFSALQGENFVSEVGYKHGTWIRKAKTWDVMASLAGSDYNRIEQLYTQGKLKDQAKADFEALKALKDELEQAGINVQELQKQLNELLTGTSVSGLADGLTALFENGKFAAQDFGQSFEDIMKKAITNSFKYKMLEDGLTPFYNEFSALFTAGTPTPDQIELLKQKYINLGNVFGEKFKELEAITGQKLTDSGGQNTLPGAIRGMSETQANALEGALNGMRITQLESNNINRGIASTSTAQLAELRSMVLLQKQIEINTGRSADVEESYLPFLKDIANNTKDSLATQLRYAGKYGL